MNIYSQECSSIFCLDKVSGDNCTMHGEVHTCGICHDTHVLFIGKLTKETAERKCFCMHYPGPECKKRRQSSRHN